MKDLKKIVRENLEKKYQLNQSFGKIALYENEDKQFIETVDLCGRLIDEGYNEEQLEQVLNEQEWLQWLFGGNKANPQDVKTQSGLIGLEKKGMWSQFKEYMVRKLLEAVGLEGALKDAAAAAIVEMSVMDLISVFRSREGCVAHSGPVVSALLEGMITYMISNNVREGSTVGNFLRNNLRNTFFEYFKQEGFDKKLGTMICNFAYKSKNNITQSIPQKLIPAAAMKQT